MGVSESRTRHTANGRGGSRHTKWGDAANNDLVFRGGFDGLVENPMPVHQRIGGTTDRRIGGSTESYAIVTVSGGVAESGTAGQG
jgi:hypothetical protein